MSDELVLRSAVSLAEDMRLGTIAARELVAAHLARIEEVNGAVNAIVSLRDPELVMADAIRADEVRAQSRDGSDLGPLHGLPIAIKDLNDVAGLPTREGSRLTTDDAAASDSLTVARLRAAGAIVVGKTNTPEFGTGSHTFNDVFGVTRNPWNLKRSAGGSSGGAAAALASRMVPIADGSDFGGSLRNPAGFCNVVGLRPSIGRIPDPVTDSTHLDRLGLQGPMARCVADTALVLSVMAGPDSRDPLSLDEDPAVFAAPLPEHTSAVVGWAADVGFLPVEAETLTLGQKAAYRAKLAGGTVRDVTPGAGLPDLSQAMTVFRILRGLRYRSLGATIPRDQWSLMKATVVENIEYGLSLTVDDVLRAERLRAQLHLEMSRFFERFDVLALPTAQVAPFPAEWEYPTEIEGQAMVDYLDWMSACCVITPTGCPALSIPAGFTANGLPVGVQLVTRVGQERKLLEVAHAIEAVEPFHQLVPPVLEPA